MPLERGGNRRCLEHRIQVIPLASINDSQRNFNGHAFPIKMSTSRLPSPTCQNFKRFFGTKSSPEFFKEMSEDMEPTLSAKQMAEVWHKSLEGELKSNLEMDAFGMPTIFENPAFDAKQSVQQLHNAMDGKTNKEQIIQSLCSISNDQRQEVVDEYKKLFDKELVAELKKALSGDFQNLIVALMTRPVIFDAQQLHKAMAGLGTNESVLIEVLVTRSIGQLKRLKRAYQLLYGRTLEEDIVSDTSGPFRHFLVEILKGDRSELDISRDEKKAREQAKQLFEAGVAKKGADDAVFVQMLANVHFRQLQLVFDEYEKLAGHSIEQALEHEYAGEDKDAFMAVVQCVRNRAAYFARLLRGTVKGLGTRDNDLIRLLVSRAEWDLAQVKEEYVKLFGKSLEKDIEGDCSGAYKLALLTLVQGNQ